jgi:inward rectifier potassium channel
VHGLHRYYTGQIRWGARHADVLSEPEPGLLVLDVRRFHDVEPTAATADFPYPT